MYQAYATLALLLVIFEYWYGGNGVRWEFITKDKKNYVCQCSKHGTQIGDTVNEKQPFLHMCNFHHKLSGTCEQGVRREGGCAR